MTKSTGPSAKNVAQWMLTQFHNNKHYMEQDSIVYEIEKNFGGDFVYTNDNGNMAIDKTILNEFKKLTADDVVWSRSERAWRKREKSDSPGRSQE